MEKLAADYSRRRITAPLAGTGATSSSASQPSDSSQPAVSAKEQNVPAFMLLDATHFYKKAHATHNQLAPVVATVRRESEATRVQLESVLEDFRASERHVGRVDRNVQEIKKDLQALDAQIDTARQDNLRTITATNRNTQDIGHIGERIDMLETKFARLQENHNDTLALHGEIRAFVAETSAMFAALQPPKVQQVGSQTWNVQTSTAALSYADIHESQYLPHIPVAKRPDVGLGAVPSREPAFHSHDHYGKLPQTSSGNPKARRPLVTYQRHAGAEAEERAGDVSASFLDYNAVSSSTRSTVTLRREPLNAPVLGDEAGSVTSGTETASDATESETVSPTPLKPDRARAMVEDRLKQAVRNRHHRPHATDNHFIWEFINAIEDKNLSKQLQSFLLTRFAGKLVTKSHASAQWKARRNGFIVMTRLSWPLFAQGVGEFLNGRMSGYIL